MASEEPIKVEPVMGQSGRMVNRPVILIPLSSANGILERSLARPFQTQPEVVGTFLQTNFPTWLNNLVHPLGVV